MTKEEIISILRAHLGELHNLGVRSLGLFGSTARGEENKKSDVDLLVDFVSPATFNAYLEVQDYCQQLLGKPVDLITRNSLRDPVRMEIEKDIIYVA